jgi:hypothetical protein
MAKEFDKMVEVTVQLPDQLAEQVIPVQRWLPTLLEFSLARLKTPASETAAEIVDFLLSNPTEEEVLAYHVSDRAQERVSRLLVLNREGMLGEVEQQELDEIERVEHIVIMQKSRVAHRVQRGPHAGRSVG